MDWQTLLDATQPHAPASSSPDETVYLLGIALIAGVMALGLLAAMLA